MPSCKRCANKASSAALPYRLEAARLARKQGALWLGRDVARAYDAFARAHSYESDDLPTLGYMIELPRQFRPLEKTLSLAKLALSISTQRAASDPTNSNRQRGLSVSYFKIADIFVAQGDRSKALAEFQKGLAITEKLAASDPIDPAL